MELRSNTGIATHRPEGDTTTPGPRLPFWLFPALEGRPPIWVAGYRCFNQPQRPDLDRLLTERRHAPRWVAAPLGARLARGPEEARSLGSACWSRYSFESGPLLVSLAAHASTAQRDQTPAELDGLLRQVEQEDALSAEMPVWVQLTERDLEGLFVGTGVRYGAPERSP